MIPDRKTRQKRPVKAAPNKTVSPNGSSASESELSGPAVGGPDWTPNSGRNWLPDRPTGRCNSAQRSRREPPGEIGGVSHGVGREDLARQPHNLGPLPWLVAQEAFL